MSKQVISSTKITKSYQISKSSQDVKGNQNTKNNLPESKSQTSYRKEIQTKFTGKNPSNFMPTQNPDNSIRIATNNKVSNPNDILQNYKYNNLDSSTGSLKQNILNSQDICTCGQFRTDTQSSYNATIQTNLTGPGYCTGDDGSIGGINYKQNTNKTYNRTININDQNIYIQEGNSTDYFNSEEKGEKKIFSNTSSAYNENLPNIYTDEEVNMNHCTLGLNQANTIDSSGRNAKIVQTQYSTNMINTSNNEFPIQTTDYDERETRHRKNIVKKIVNTEINIEVIRQQVREKIRQEIKEEKERHQEQTLWNGENYIQIIERLQYLSSPAPPLRVQFLNDMMINKTINTGPIQVLIPIPDNYIEKQEELAFYAEQKEKEEEVVGEELCPENVDLLNISQAYSIPVPSFNNLEIESEEMVIEGKPNEKQEIVVQEKEPFVIENYSWDINASERMWSGVMRPMRVNKLIIEVPTKPDWNDFIRTESVAKINVKAPIKEEIQEEIEEEQEEEEPEEESVVEEIEEIEEEVETKDNEERKRRLAERAEREKRRKERELKKKKNAPKKLKKHKFQITYRQNKKRFKLIDLGENEMITLKAERRILPSEVKRIEKIIEPSNETNIMVGGNGFDYDKFKWSLEPFNAQTLTIEKTNRDHHLENVPIERMAMKAEKARPKDWNLVNDLSSESTINILTKEKVITEENIKSITVLGKASNKNKWNEKSRQHKGPKVVYGPSKKKFTLKIIKEIDIAYEQETDDVIINDDYNNVKGPEMRPITATIIKVKEEDDTSSVSSYDVFQNLIIKKSTYEYGYSGSNLKNFEFGKFDGIGNFGLGKSKKYEMGSGRGTRGSGEEKKFKTTHYEYEFSRDGFGPMLNKNFVTQTKISSNSGNFMNGGRGENFKFGNLGEQGKQSIKLRVSSENEQKNKYDKTVKNLASQTKNLIDMNMRDTRNIIGERKKVELIRDDNEQTNFLKI